MINTKLYGLNDPATILAQKVVFIDYPGLDRAELRIDSGEHICDNCGQVHVNQEILQLQWDDIQPKLFPVRITRRTPVESKR